jgi:hypothetical protein
LTIWSNISFGSSADQGHFTQTIVSFQLAYDAFSSTRSFPGDLQRAADDKKEAASCLSFMKKVGAFFQLTPIHVPHEVVQRQSVLLTEHFGQNDDQRVLPKFSAADFAQFQSER